MAGFHKGDGGVGGEGVYTLNSTQHFLVVDEADGLERAIVILLGNKPVGCFFKHGAVDIDKVFSFGETLQHESSQPQAALGVVLPEGGKTAVAAPVG